MIAAPARRLEVLPDGTVRQQSPLTGTEVWTVPGRSHRPLPSHRPPPSELAASRRDATCAFCPQRYLETTPEKSRLVLRSDLSDGWRIERGLTAEQVTAEVADVRRFANLYEILPFSYWQANHSLRIPTDALARARGYVATPAGRAHVEELLHVRARAAGGVRAELPPHDPEPDLAVRAIGLFAGTHDLVVPRRHWIDGATRDDQLCSAGDLPRDEHYAMIALTVATLRELVTAHPFVRYVSVFQNWLGPAGASFEHLHKQLLAIDELGPLMNRIVTTLEAHPDLFNSHVVEPAAAEGLVVAGNEHALAVVGVGHRYPTVELYALGGWHQPWQLPDGALRGMSDLLHACHAASGRLVPTNEEWHYRPLELAVPMPWRINLKWRVSTLAGFEGSTKINVNTISPMALRERMVAGLHMLRQQGRIADLAIGDECRPGPEPLRYREG